MNKFGKITLIFFLLTCCSCFKKEPSSSSSFSSEIESIYSSDDSKGDSSQSSLEYTSSQDNTSISSINTSSNDSSSSEPIKEEMNFIDYISDGIYNENEDNTQGVDSQDLSKLIDYFDNLVCSSYVVDSKNYLSSQAISKYNQIYDREYTSNIRAVVSNNYRYYFNQELKLNDAYIDYQNSIIRTSLIGNTLSGRLTGSVDSSKITIYENNSSCKNYFFGLEDITPSYINSYGPYQEVINSSLTIDYNGWTKVSENKYRCDRKEVIENLLSLISYNYQNDGLFLTYDYLTVEINFSEEVELRIRVYVSSTQSGKLIASHINEANTNWYLLAHEAIIYNLDNAYVSAIEEFLNR